MLANLLRSLIPASFLYQQA